MATRSKTLASRSGILVALLHRDFRLFWFGHTSAVSGQQMFIMIQAWLIYDLTGSALQLGLVSLARAVPAFVLGLAGGVVADRVDQRRLLMTTTAATSALYALLATLTLTGVTQVWHILGTVFFVGALQAFEQPSRQALFPHLIDRSHITQAVALNSTVHPGTRIVAPLLAGVLIDHVGIPRTGAAVAVYLVSGAYLSFTWFLSRIRVPHVTRASSGSAARNLVDGVKYIVNSHTFRFVIGMSFANAFFGMAHVALLPIFADRLLGSSTGSGLGLLFSAGGLGGFAGALIAGSVGNMRRKGWLIVGGSSGFGLCLMAFAVSPWYGLSAGLEWLGSLSNQLFMVTGQSTLHRLVPDDYRGRVMGIWGMTHSVAQPFGGFQMGGLASVFSAPIAVAAGGGIIALFAIAGAGRDSRIRNLGIKPGGDDQPVHPSRRHNLTHTWRC